MYMECVHKVLLKKPMTELFVPSTPPATAINSGNSRNYFPPIQFRSLLSLYL